MEHDFYQPLLTDRLLQQQNVIVRPKISSTADLQPLGRGTILSQSR